MKRLVTIIALFAILFSCVVGSSFAESEEFSVRGGVKFGMTPEEVIAIEEANGFYYDLTSKGEILYNTGTEYNLYYQSNAGKLGSLEIMRFEYDFDLVNKKMFQFYYVFKEQNAFSYLSSALSGKYGSSDNTSKNSTQKYLETGASSHLSHDRWAIPNGEQEVIIIDLWDNEYNVCFLSYQIFNKQKMMEEDEALDFGL